MGLTDVKKSQTSSNGQYSGANQNGSQATRKKSDFERRRSCDRTIVVGICAMAKKSRGKPMTEIVLRMKEYYPPLKVFIFDDNVIQNEPVENWPICDSLISFYSTGFPLQKAVQYVKLRKPFVINDLQRQFDLLNRKKIYRQLQRSGIQVPRYAVLQRSAVNSTEENQTDPADANFEEEEDLVEVYGQTFIKPFVEKPIDAENHNIVIYFPLSAGGGSQWLFRKIGDRSSNYEKIDYVRRDGSYIYEEYLPTDGVDVKVYAIGPYYAHAEARKSPGLDGKVERNSKGKEVRYPVILSSAEKLIAKRVVLSFKQNICGFDLLRCNGRSVVCDVNGFSFVKNSVKYYEDAANILGNMIMCHLANDMKIPWSPNLDLDVAPLTRTTYGEMMELRSVIAIIRHGDRTPKQKLKMEVKHPKFFELFRKYNGFKKGHLKLKRPNELQAVLDLARNLLHSLNGEADQDTTHDWTKLHSKSALDELKQKLEQIKDVLEMYGHFSGLNRKVQMKYLTYGSSKWKEAHPKVEHSHLCDPDPTILLILKWGGELTDAGVLQAEELGKAFRTLYPGNTESDTKEGLGFLRIHSTYRHDLKIYASEEGRVQTTAGAFTKGLLALEGEIAPILVQMVRSADTSGLLEDCQAARRIQDQTKHFLFEKLQQDKDLSNEDMKKLNPLADTSIQRCMQAIKNPFHMCENICILIDRLAMIIHEKKVKSDKTGNLVLYGNESLSLMDERWSKLKRDFRRVVDGKVRFDISKIPDIYDNAKYCFQHNAKTIKFDQIDDLYILSKCMADIIVHQEYGITELEKLMIGQGICTPLLEKIQTDLKHSITDDTENEMMTRLDARYSEDIKTPMRHVRTRLYFTSESHIHSIMNLIRYGGLCDSNSDEQWDRALRFLDDITEYNYMSQLVFMLYENPNKEIGTDDRFHIEIHFSPGALPCIASPNALNGQQMSLDSLSCSLDSTENGLAVNISEDNGTDSGVGMDSGNSDSLSSEARNNAQIESPCFKLNWDNPDSDLDDTEDLITTKFADPLNYMRPLMTTLPKLKESTTHPILDASPVLDTIEEDQACSDSETHLDRTLYLMSNSIPLKRRSRQTSMPCVWENKPQPLICTDVIRGKHHTTEEIISETPSDGITSYSDPMDTPILGNTSVVLLKKRRTTLPINSVTYQIDFSKVDAAEQNVAEFVPPLRSLETLHNRLSHHDLDLWIEKHTAAAHASGFCAS